MVHPCEITPLDEDSTIDIRTACHRGSQLKVYQCKELSELMCWGSEVYTGVTGTNPPWIDYQFLLHGHYHHFCRTGEQTGSKSPSDWVTGQLYLSLPLPMCWEREAPLVCQILLWNCLCSLSPNLPHCPGEMSVTRTAGTARSQRCWMSCPRAPSCKLWSWDSNMPLCLSSPVFFCVIKSRMWLFRVFLASILCSHLSLSGLEII